MTSPSYTPPPQPFTYYLINDIKGHHITEEKKYLRKLIHKICNGGVIVE